MANFARTNMQLLDDNIEWEKSGGFRKTCYNLPNGRTIRVRFITDPSTMDADHGWCVYREVNAWNGLIGDIKMPNGLKEFPVDDFDIVEPFPGELRKVRKKDLYQMRVKPSRFDMEDGRNFASASTKIITSVVFEGGSLEKEDKWNPPVGQVILLKWGKRAFDLLESKLEDRRDEDPNFTLAGTVWEILVEGTGINSKLSMSRVKNPEPMDLPDPLDTVDYVNNIRRQAEKFIDSLDGAAESYVVEDTVVESEEDVTNAYEANRANIAAAAQIEWENVSLARIRAKLKEQGVFTGPKPTRDELIALAKEHLDGSAA